MQAFSIISENIAPYYDADGKVNPNGKAFWEDIHNRLSVELGLKSLSQMAYSYQTAFAGKQTTVSGAWPIITVCENWMHADPVGVQDVDAFIKERLSLVEIAFRKKEAAVAKANAELPQQILKAKLRPAGGLRIPSDPAPGLKAWNKNLNEAFQASVDELNTRFRQAGCGLHYHNGFIQISEDPLFLKEAEQPFWQLVSDPLWKNVDIDMKEAIDRRDNGDRDPAWYAVRALESAIKIISDKKEWTRGGERGAHNYIDNLAKRDAQYIESWEAEALKAIFTKLRNPLGHGPGSAEMPSFTPQQTDLAIELCISWIKSLIKRF
ncbi:hypothetical protein FHS62_000277 [Amphiplicatus metriothermophilus]|nr:hypothetical protein [Amphiplicatus metriothermophilus]